MKKKILIVLFAMAFPLKMSHAIDQGYTNFKSSVNINGLTTATTIQISGKIVLPDGTVITSTSNFGGSGGGGGVASGASSLGVFQNGVSISSPTNQINFIGPPFSLTLGGASTATVTLNASSVTLQGNTFNTGSNLLQLSGGLVPNSNIDSSSVTKYGASIPSNAIAAGSLGSSVIASSIAVSGVTAGSYGSASQVPSITLGADGRATSASNTTISLTNSNLQSGTYSNVTVPSANVASGALGSSVIVSSIAANSVLNASIVSVDGSKVTGTASIPNAAIDGSSITKAGVLTAGTNITLTPSAGFTSISSTADLTGLLTASSATANFIRNSSNFQTGANFNVTSGTFSGELNIGNLSISTATSKTNFESLSDSISFDIAGSDVEMKVNDGNVGFTSEIQLLSGSDIVFNAPDNASLIGFKSPNATYSSVIYELPAGDADGYLKSNGAGILSWQTPTSTSAIGITFDGGGSAYVAGSTVVVTVPYSCTISSWAVVANSTGSISIDIKKSTFADYPNLTSMVGAGNKPSLINQQKDAETPSSWTSTAITSGDTLSFVVDSSSAVIYGGLTLWVTKP